MYEMASIQPTNTHTKHSFQSQEPGEQDITSLFKNLGEIADDEWNKENNALKEKYEALEENVTQLREDLQRFREENDELKEKCSSLQINNHYLEKELENKKQSGYKLKGKLIKYYEDGVNAKRLKRENVSEELKTILSEILQRAVNVEELVATKIRALAEEIKKHNSEEKDKHLERLRSKCERCDQDLRKRGIVLRSPFTDSLEKYRTLSERNDSAAKDMLKATYDSGKLAKNIRQRWESFIKHLTDDLAALEGFERIIFPNATLLKWDLQAETRLYDDVVATAEEEITRKLRRLRDLDSKTSKSKRKKSTARRKSNFLKDDKTEEWLEMNNDTKEPALNTSNQTDSSRSIILFGVPDKKKDGKMVSAFLARNKFEDDEYKITRLGGYKPGFFRPLVITFTKEKIVDQILELKREKGWFNGLDPGIRKFHKR